MYVKATHFQVEHPEDNANEAVGFLAAEQSFKSKLLSEKQKKLSLFYLNNDIVYILDDYEFHN